MTGQTLENLFAQGVSYHQGGNLMEAEKIYQSILSANPANAQALYLMAMAARQRNDHEAAESYLQKALKAAPKVPDFHFTLGLWRQEAGEYAEAIAHYRDALKLNPAYLQAQANMGVAYQDQGRYDKAVECFKKVLQKDPRHVNALNNLGNTYQMRGDYEQAIGCYQQILALSSHIVDVWDNLGIALFKTEEYAEAQKCFEQAIHLDSGYSQAYLNLGRVAEEKKDYATAMECFQAAIGLNPDYPHAYNALANMLYKLGEYDAAREAYSIACTMRPDEMTWQLRLATLCPIIQQSEEQVAAVRAQIADSLRALSDVPLNMSLSDLADGNCEPSFYLPYHGQDDRPLKSAYGDLLAKNLPALDVPPLKTKVDTERPKVGFLVTPKHEGIFARLFGSTVARLSPEKLDVYVICAQESIDPIRAEVPEAERLKFVTIAGGFDAVLGQIRAEAFDIAFAFETGTDSLNYFLPLYRMAPIQCTTWGFPVTSGLPTMDYFLSSSRFEEAEHQRYYREALVRLPSMLSYFHRPSLPEEPYGREHFGIAPDTHVYGCLQSIFKFHPEMDRVFNDILRRDPQGQLFLLEGHTPEWTQHYADRLKAAMDADCFERVRFLPRMSRAEYLSFQALSDVSLDPLHYGGGTTTMEALAFGTPVVTLPSEHLRARLTYGFYRRMELDDGIAANAEQYVELALRYGTDAEVRQAAREKILSRCHGLFNDESAVRDLEAFFLQAVTAASAKG